MASSLTETRVVVTRSSADNAPLAAALRDRGAEVVELPLVEVVEPADGGHALRVAVDRLTDYRYVTLTSTNGVRAVAEAVGDRPWPAGVVVAPVGPVTAKLAAEAGMTVGPVPSSATVADLISEFPMNAASEICRVLAPLAELAGDSLVDGLTAKGYVVDRCEAYRTVGPSADTVAGELAEVGDGFDAVLFFSPSAVDRFVDLVPPSHRQAADGMPVHGPLAICIGPATANRAAAHERWNVMMADPHTEAGVVETLVAQSATGQRRR